MANIDYGQILSRSKDLVFKHKWLWVYGLVLAVFSGSSGSSFNSGRGFSNLSPQSKPTTLPQNFPSDLPEKTKEVLGATTSSIQAWLTHVPISTWVLLALGILALIIISFVVQIIITNWAKGALISGLADADAGHPVTLLSTSPKGLASLKRLVLYSLFITAIIFAAIFIFILLILLGLLVFSASSVLMGVWMVLVLIFGGIAFLVTMVILGMVNIFADRLIVLHGYTPLAAWKKGLSLSKGNFLQTILLGIINAGIGCGVGCLSLLILGVVIGIPALIIGISMFSGGFHLPSLPVIGILVTLILIAVHANLFISALLVVFKYSNWNLFVKTILDQEKNL